MSITGSLVVDWTGPAASNCLLPHAWMRGTGRTGGDERPGSVPALQPSLRVQLRIRVGHHSAADAERNSERPGGWQPVPLADPALEHGLP